MPNLNAKQAVEIAVKYLIDVVSIPKSDISVEEIDFEEGEDSDNWIVTLGLPKKQLGSISREYKVFTVNDEDEEVVSMKIKHV